MLAFFKEVGVKYPFLVWMQDIGAIMVNHEVIGVMLTAFLELLDFLLEVVHDLIPQEFELQISAKQRHRLSLFVMNRRDV